MSLYDISVKTVNNEELLMSMFKGKVLLIVNTASK
ncbi:MAG: Glutathione peroxidase [Bacillales bacterium]|jgi:glutathione peroxidase-family protein|nr:Glutathione peroxidase [Bacillales bacterium]